MEKHIASHDLSDMMVHEGIHELSLKFYPKQKWSQVKKIVEKGFRALELALKYAKRTLESRQRSLRYRQYRFASTAAAFYSISLVSAVVSFFWFMLLLSV